VPACMSLIVTFYFLLLRLLFRSDLSVRLGWADRYAWVYWALCACPNPIIISTIVGIPMLLWDFHSCCRNADPIVGIPILFSDLLCHYRNSYVLLGMPMLLEECQCHCWNSNTLVGITMRLLEFQSYCGHSNPVGGNPNPIGGLPFLLWEFQIYDRLSSAMVGVPILL
jgi:hypothetical protein